MKAVVEMEKRAGRNRQLTERDRELCGFLAVCRYLTREQIERLMFPGRSKARSSTRLRQLASSMGEQAAVVRGDLGYASAEGWATVWALTAEGFDIGSQLLNLKLARTPKHDVGPWFLKHEVILNEVFLGLMPQDGKTPARVPRGFRWVLGEYLDLPFNDFAPDRRGFESRRLQPDAILEDPAGQRRYFVEYETGSATICAHRSWSETIASELQKYGGGSGITLRQQRGLSRHGSGRHKTLRPAWRTSVSRFALRTQRSLSATLRPWGKSLLSNLMEATRSLSSWQTTT